MTKTKRTEQIEKALWKAADYLEDCDQRGEEIDAEAIATTIAEHVVFAHRQVTDLLFPAIGNTMDKRRALYERVCGGKKEATTTD